MSAEEVTLRGYVIGDEGKPIAGWVSLGLEQPQRWLSRNVRIETDDGYEVSVEELAGDSLVPVTKLDVRWGDIQSDDLAQLCYREAPDEETQVEFREAVIRGGDPIVVWGEVADYGYAGGEDTQSPAYQGGAPRTISRLQARVVAYGENCEQFFNDAKSRWITKHVAPVALPRASAAVKTQMPATAIAPVAILSDRDYKNRLAFNTPLALAAAALLGCIVVGIVTRQGRPMLLAAAAMAGVPLALDTVLIGRFRNGHVAPPSLDVPLALSALCVVAATMLGLGIAVGDIEETKAEALHAFSYLFGIGAVATSGWLWLKTRARRSWVASMYNAPRHIEPLRDGVWGGSDGLFSSDVMSIGDTATTFRAGKVRNTKKEKFANLTYEAELMTYERKVRRVRLAEASILSMVRLDRDAGDGRTVHADVITGRMPVRLVGRQLNGMFIKAGVLVRAAEGSLLVFASGLGTNVGKELRKLYLRDWTTQVLAAVGALLLLLAFIV